MLGLSACLALLDNEEDHVVYTEFYTRYHRFVLKQALNIVNNWQSAEDVTQEVMVYAAENFGKFRDRPAQQVLHYLYLCARGRALNLLQKEQRNMVEENAEVMDAAIDSLNVEKVVISRDTIERMYQAISELPDIYRIPLELKVLDLTAKEIAEMLGLPLPTIYKQIARGCKNLKERMVREDGD